MKSEEVIRDVLTLKPPEKAKPDKNSTTAGKN